MKNKNIVIVILGLVLAGGVLFFFNFQSQQSAKLVEKTPVAKTEKKEQEASPSPIKALFTCKDGKSIDAVFSGNTVSLILSDGRKLELNQTLSASGARYANEDGSFVFWNKGDTAFIEEKEKTAYSDCLQK